MFNFVEELPPSRPGHVIKIGVIATLLVLTVVAGYVLLNPRPAQPHGEVLDVRLYSAEPPVSADGVMLASASTSGADSKNLLVLTPVQIHNTTNRPLTLTEITGIVRMGSAEYDSADVSPEDFQKVFAYYPGLDGYRQPQLASHALVQPGETAAGLLVFHYPISEEQWGRRDSFQVKAAFDHGQDILLTGTNTPQTLSEAREPAR